MFFLINIFVTSLLFISFMKISEVVNVIPILYIIISAISTSIMFNGIICIVSMLFQKLTRLKKYFSISSIVFIDMFIILDFFIFKIYRFHINGMVLNILYSPSAWENIHPGIIPITVFCILLLFFIIFQNWLYKYSKLKFYRINIKKSVVFLLTIVFFEKMIFGFCSLYGITSITTSIGCIPFYQPVTFSRFAYKYFGVKTKTQENNGIGLKISNLNYPLNDIQINKKEKNRDIYLFVSDAVRNDIISEKNTPEIYRFSEKNLKFDNHYSGGNSTRFGIFSLMYGINSSYWFSFERERKGSIFFDVIKKRGYKIKIISSSNLSWPEFRNTCFKEVQENIKDNFEGTPSEKDLMCSEFFVEDLEETEKDKPVFYFVFFDSPHGPYSYPLEEAIFKPDNDGILNYMNILEEDKEYIFNQYLNAVNFNDMLIGNMLEGIKRFRDYKDSIIIITSDHGEEFFENGRFGHNSSFSNYQTNSFLTMKWPGKEKKVYDHMTSHIDIIPTLMEDLGVKNPISDYSNGYNIFEEIRKSVFISNWTNCAVKTLDYTFVFPYNSGAAFSGASVMDNKNYHEKDNKLFEENSDLILKELTNNSMFLK